MAGAVVPKFESGADRRGELRDLVLKGHCVAFIGAGMSNPPGQQHRETVENIASRCNVEVNNRPLPEVIDACEETNPDEYETALRDMFPKHVAGARTGLIYLFRLPFKAFVTTNVDPWVRNLATQHKIQRVHVYPDLPLHEGLSKALYYIHGCCDPENPRYRPGTLIFGAKSFSQAYSRGSLLPGFLLNLFTYERVLFVGFDPSEKHIADLLTRAKIIRQRINTDTVLTNLPKRFLLWPSLMESDERAQGEWDAKIEEFRALEVTPVIYDPENNDHRGLERILYEWVGEGDLLNRPPAFKTGFDLSGATE